MALPGVVLHELAHYLVCRIVGVRVHEVVYFQRQSPAGYVVHARPHQLRQLLVVVLGPLLVNSGLCFGLFRVSAAGLERLLRTGLSPDVWPIIEVGLAFWLAWSIGLQAIPSAADAGSLWGGAWSHWSAGHWRALAALPVAGVLFVANAGRRFWLDWLYVAVLGWLALGSLILTTTEILQRLANPFL